MNQLASNAAPSTTEPNLSAIVAGAWRLGDWGWNAQQRLAWIEGNLERGLSSFDHADIYGDYQAEALFGQALALAPGLRQRMQLVSKCGIRLLSTHRPEHGLKSYDSSAAHILASAEHSLRQLRTDHLDLLLIHRPDALMQADEVAEAFCRLRQAGKVLHFGVSNFTPRQFDLLHSRIPLVTNQIECSPLHLDPLHDGTLDQAQQLRLRPMIWSPLAGGRLFDAQDERSQRVRHVLTLLAQQHGVSLSTVAIAWLLRHPSQVRPVIGSRRLTAADEAMAATRLKLSAEAWYQVWQASTGHEVP